MLVATSLLIRCFRTCQMKGSTVLALVASLRGDLGTFLFEVLTTIVPLGRVDDFPGLAAGIHLLVSDLAVFSIHLSASTYSETANQVASIRDVLSEFLSIPNLANQPPL